MRAKKSLEAANNDLEIQADNLSKVKWNCSPNLFVVHAIE